MRTINIYAYKGDTRTPYEVMAEEVTQDFEQLYKKKSATHAICIFRHDIKGRKRQETSYFRVF